MSLPIRLEPVGGESLSGYMLRLSSTYGIPPGDIGRNIGFWPVAQDFDRRRSGYKLDPEQVQNISSATGLSEERVQAMTLEHLNGKVFNADPVKQIAKGIPAAIGKRITTWETAFCPVCLKEHGTWLLNWHSRWNLICEAHGCELIESCPGCGKPPSALRRITWPTKKGEVEKDPTCCWWSTGGKLCRLDLKEIQVRPVDFEVLEAHRTLTSMTTGTRTPTMAGEKVDSVAFIADLMGLMYIVRLDETPSKTESTYRSLEGTGQQREIASSREEKIRLLPKAIKLAMLASETELVDAIRKIANNIYTRSSLRLPQLRIFPGHSKPFGDAVGHARETSCYANVSARYGFDKHRHRRPADLDASIEPRHVPQLFWGREFDEEVWSCFDGIDFTRWRARRFCSVILLRMLKPMTWEEGALSLGFPPDRYGHKALTQAMSELRKFGREPDLIEAIKAVANAKASNHELVDFRELEVQMADWEGVDSETYRYLQPKYNPVKQHSAHVRQRSFVSTMIWADVTESDETLSKFWRARGPYEATQFRQKNMHRIGPRFDRLLEIVRENPGSSVQLHRGMLIGDLATGDEISPRFRRHELSQELAERTLIHVSSYTGVDIPTITAKVSNNTRPVAATHARILVAFVLHRLGGCYWDQVREVLNAATNSSVSQPVKHYLDRIRDTSTMRELNVLTAQVRDGRTKLPHPAGPRPHLERMTELALEINALIGERAPSHLSKRQTKLVSLRACEAHTDLRWTQLEQVHGIADYADGLSQNPYKGYQLETEGEEFLAEVLPEAFSLRIRAGYGKSDLRRGLTMAQKATR